jgi:hypothetical protein
MKTVLSLLSICLLLAIVPAFAHHPAADIVDEEIYDMIDSLVADTPHADLDFADMDGDVEIMITTQQVEDMESMIDDGLITYVSSLSGRVSVEIAFKGGGRTIFTVTQIK